MTDKEQALLDEYAYLQWHKLWLSDERKKADKRQDEITKELQEI